jgi:hypothetical protein
MYEMQGPHFGLTNPPGCRLLSYPANRLASSCQRTRAMSSCLVFALRRCPLRSASGVASESASGVSSEAARWPTNLHDARLPGPRTASGILSREPSGVSPEVPLESPPKRSAVQVVGEFLLPPTAPVQEVSLTFSRFFFHPQDT